MKTQSQPQSVNAPSVRYHLARAHSRSVSGHTKSILNWGSGRRTNKIQNDDDPTMQTTMFFNWGRDWFLLLSFSSTFTMQNLEAKSRGTSRTLPIYTSIDFHQHTQPQRCCHQPPPTSKPNHGEKKKRHRIDSCSHQPPNQLNDTKCIANLMSIQTKKQFAMTPMTCALHRIIRLKILPTHTHERL